MLSWVQGLHFLCGYTVQLEWLRRRRRKKTLDLQLCQSGWVTFFHVWDCVFQWVAGRLKASVSHHTTLASNWPIRAVMSKGEWLCSHPGLEWQGPLRLLMTDHRIAGWKSPLSLFPLNKCYLCTQTDDEMVVGWKSTSLWQIVYLLTLVGVIWCEVWLGK